MKWSFRIPKDLVWKIKVGDFFGLHYEIGYENREVDIDWVQDANYAVVEFYDLDRGVVTNSLEFDKVKNVVLDMDNKEVEVRISYG